MTVQFKNIEECGCPAHAWRYHYHLEEVQPCDRAALRATPGRVFLPSSEYVGWYTTLDIAFWDSQFESFVAECGALVDLPECVTGNVARQVVLVEQTPAERDARRKYVAPLPADLFDDDDWDPVPMCTW